MVKVESLPEATEGCIFEKLHREEILFFGAQKYVKLSV